MLQIHRRLIVLTKTNGRCEFIFSPEVLSQCNTIPHTMQILEGYNFRGFRGQLAICEIFMLEISSAKPWLASIGDHARCL